MTTARPIITLELETEDDKIVFIASEVYRIRMINVLFSSLEEPRLRLTQTKMIIPSVGARGLRTLRRLTVDTALSVRSVECVNRIGLNHLRGI